MDQVVSSSFFPGILNEPCHFFSIFAELHGTDLHEVTGWSRPRRYLVGRPDKEVGQVFQGGGCRNPARIGDARIAGLSTTSGFPRRYLREFPSLDIHYSPDCLIASI
jgi:hypothetical protein